jgi:hypothetical protein
VLLLLVAAADVALAAGQITEELVFDPARLSIAVDARDGEPDLATVRYAGALSATSPGRPDLPEVPIWLEVPPGTRVRSLVAEPLETEEVARGLHVAAAVPDHRPGEAPESPAAGPVAIDAASGLVPDAWATLGAGGSKRGHQLVSVLARPVRWEPSSGRLIVARRLSLTLELEADPGPAPLARHRVVPAIERRFERALAGSVRGLRSLVATGPASGGPAAGFAGSGPAGDGPYQPTFRPTTDGSPVEYVIITSDVLANEFQRLADWKTAKGVQAVVRTVEWIDATYPNGVDRAERIRFFIRDAYQNWGTLWVVLGGDTDVIPVRYAYWAFLGGEFIPTDLYYACLDGNWNADGDGLFGEAPVIVGGDDVDFLNEVSVGRFTVSTVPEAAGTIDKLLRYEREAPSISRYPASLLVMAERLFVNQHGAELAEEALAHVHPWFNVVRLYEESENWPGSLELTRSAALDSLENGFGLVLHVGHGYRNTMSVGDGTLNNADADALQNDPLNPVVFAINCSSAAIDFNSIGERWLKNPDGGSVAYIGTSRIAYIAASEASQNAWFTAAFDDSVRSIGLSTDLARQVLVPYAGQDSAWRWNLFATTLLGDPELELYLNAIPPLAVSHPGSFTLGVGSMAVGVSSAGQPVAGATVSLQREGEAYGVGETDAGGIATVPFLPETPGPIDLTVWRSPYRFYETTLPATAPGSGFLHIDGIAVDDDGSGASSGDGDGLVDAGETVELAVTLHNGGGSTVNSTLATLTVDDPLGAVTLVNDVVSYGTIPAGGEWSGSTRFVVSLAPDAPVAYQPVFHLDIQAIGGQWEDVFTLDVHRPYLEHHAHTIDDSAPRGNGDGLVQAGEEIWYTVSLRNTGQDAANGVVGTLRVVAVADSQPHPGVTVLDDVTAPGTIDVGETVAGDRVSFALGGAVDPSTILVELSWSDDHGPIRTEWLDVVPPAVPDSIVASGTSTSITLRWHPPADEDIKGYDVYRAGNPFGPYLRQNAYTIDGSASYEDADLPGLTRFYYQLVARDSSYNQSSISVIVSGTTNPPLKRGWPNALQQQTQSSVVFANTTGDDALELFTAGEYQYGYLANGGEIRDGDGDERTHGVFAPQGYNQNKGFSATTGVGDLDRDGDLEIANTGWTQDSLFVWDHEGQLLPGWPRWMMDDLNWPSPVLADLDADHDLELVAWAGGGGRLMAWHHDGTEVVDGDANPATDGVMFRVFGTSFSYSSPAVGNLDDDPEAEIVFCVNLSDSTTGRVYVVENDGTLKNGWPFATGSPSTPSQITASPAIADLDRDGDYEIVVAADRAGGRLYALNGDGTLVPGWPRPVAVSSGLARSSSPVAVDLVGDERLEVVFVASDGQLHVRDAGGASISGFPVTYLSGGTETTQSTPSVADVDGDGQLEILFGDESGKVHGYNHDGTQLAGFPIQVTGEVRSTPAVWDIDQDGEVEVMVQCWDTNVYVWDMPATFNPTRMPWPVFRHDSRNTGWAHVAVLPVGIEDPGATAASPAAAPRVYDPYPNPFNPHTTLAFDLPGEGARHVRVAVYDVAGRLVRELLDGAVDAGHHRLRWDGRTARGGQAPSGVYLYRVTIDGFEQSGKLVLVQ